MTKAIKLHVGFDGYYGGHVDEYCLLPVEWNGLYMKELIEATYEDEIGLGEIAGKHSDCYGDLTVDIIDLEKLNGRELNSLLEGSSSSDLEGYFEHQESNYIGDVEYFSDDKIKFITEEQKKLEERYGVEIGKWSIASYVISEVFVNNLKKNLDKYVEISVKENDFKAAIDALVKNGIETF